MLARIAHATGSRPRRTLLALLAFLVVAGAIGGPVAGALKGSGGFVTRDADSEVAVRQFEAATGREPTPGVQLLVATPRGAAAARARTSAVADRLDRIPGIVRVSAPAAVARDGRHVLVTGTESASASDDDVADAAGAAFADAHDVTVGGPVVADRQINSTVKEDLGRAELIALPFLFVLSLLFFRGRAALMPLLVGLTTVLGTFLVLSGVNHVYGLSVFALNLVIGLGLGLAIDYTLLLVTRFREELDGGSAVPAAIRTTMTTAGRTVAFSAGTVAAALITLTLFPQGFLKSMGIAGAVVAVVAALAALTVSPALLGAWGRKLLRGGERRPAVDARWYRLAHAVMRRPGRVAAATALVMVCAAAPALTVSWSPVDSSAVPTGDSARVVSDAIDRDFGGAGHTAVTVAVTAPRRDAAAVAAYARQVRRIDGVERVGRPTAVGASLWQVSAAVSGDPAGASARRVVEQTRAIDAPFATRVTGPAASFVDQQSAIGSHLVPAVAALAALTFIVLWLMTGSVVLPLKAIVMNALTVGAALAPLVLIYQHGRLTGLLGYTPNGGVEPSDFVVTATLVFALSTDYGVFLLGRIIESRGGVGEREAVATGLARTGRVVTAAAILLAVAIGAFSTSSISFIQQIGVATATGVLIDAFIVRSLLVPSLMALLGRWNWWAPRPLRRLRGRIAVAL